jgi:hypothetical protein
VQTCAANPCMPGERCNFRELSTFCDHCASNELGAGMLTQGGQGGRPASLDSRLYRIPTHILLNLHGI